jgi:hypothetical protein
MNTLTKEEKRIYSNRETKVLNGIEVFLCKKYDCWLTEEGCLKVQRKNSTTKQGSDRYIFYANSLRDNLCSICSYSKIIQKLHNTKIYHRQDMPKNYIIKCNCCGEMVTRDELHKTADGKPLGRVCYNCVKNKQTQRRDERRFKI